MDREFSGLYTQLGETKEGLAAVEDDRRKSGIELSQLHDDCDRAIASINAFQKESIAKMDALAATLQTHNTRNGTWSETRNGSPGLRFDSDNGAYIPDKLYFTSESSCDYLKPFTTGGLAWNYNSDSYLQGGQFYIRDLSNEDNQVYMFALGAGSPGGCRLWFRKQVSCHPKAGRLSRGAGRRIGNSAIHINSRISRRWADIL